MSNPTAQLSIDAAISLLLALVNNASQISDIITKARAAGKTELTQEEWDTIVAKANAARAQVAADVGAS